MKPFIETCKMIWGTHWIKPAAEQLKCSRRWMQNIANEVAEPNEELYNKLKKYAHKHASRLNAKAEDM